MKKILLLAICMIGFGMIGQSQNTLDDKGIKNLKLEDGIYALMTTTKGDILIKLEHEKTPLTVANFVGLAEGNFEHNTFKATKPFYDGLKFHRVINNFMIQGGDPAGTGSGGPGYKFFDEVDTDLKHDRAGILSMANSGPATNGSQFFITHKETPWLNGKHTIFGNVIHGQDVVNSIIQNDTIVKLNIIRKGKEAEEFNATELFKEKYKAIEVIHNQKVAAEKVAAEHLRKVAERKRKMSDAERMSEFKEKMFKKYPNAEITESGLMYVVDNAGDGNKPEVGKNVTVHYTGYLTTGKKFDSSVDRGQPFSFPLGMKRVIAGWDEGVALMSKGAKYKLLIPYWLGYGETGGGPIPPFADLIFDVELLGF